MARFVTAQEAVQYIHSGDRVVLAHSVGEPQALVDAMLENYRAYHDVEVCHMLALGPCKYARPEMAGHFRHHSLFAGPGSRERDRYVFRPGRGTGGEEAAHAQSPRVS